MAVPLRESYLLIASAGCLLASAALSVAHTRLRAFEQAANLLALAFLGSLLALCAQQSGGWPTTTTAEVLVATVAAGTLWRVLHRDEAQPKLAGVVFAVLAVGLLAWSATRWPGPATRTALAPTERIWLSATHLSLALACGAFVEAGALAAACLLNDTRGPAACNADPVRHALLPGLPLLTLSLLLRSLAGQYISGVAWSWTASESWQLLVWLFYAIMWMAWAVRGWHGRRMQLLVAVGPALALLMLNAWAR